jgi:hypothetical protein
MPSQTHWDPTYFAHDPAPGVIILPPGQPAASSVAFAGGWPHNGGANFLEVTPPNAYDHAVIPLSYGTGGGAIHATAMARHATLYRGAADAIPDRQRGRFPQVNTGRGPRHRQLRELNAPR